MLAQNWNSRAGEKSLGRQMEEVPWVCAANLHESLSTRAREKPCLEKTITVMVRRWRVIEKDICANLWPPHASAQMCLNIHMVTHTNTHTHTHTHTHPCTFVHEHSYGHTHVCIYVHEHSHGLTYTHTCICTYVHEHSHGHTHISTHLHVCA